MCDIEKAIFYQIEGEVVRLELEIFGGAYVRCESATADGCVVRCLGCSVSDFRPCTRGLLGWILFGGYAKKH